MKTCPQCNSSFEPIAARIAARQIYCSIRCRSKANRRTHRYERATYIKYKQLRASTKPPKPPRPNVSDDAKELTCIVCERVFPRNLKVDDKPRKNESPCCGARCRKRWKQRNTPKLPPTEVRPCAYCGAIFKPFNRSVICYCSSRCKRAAWQVMHADPNAPERARARAARVERRRRLKLERKLLRILRRWLRLKALTEPRRSVCATCATPIEAGRRACANCISATRRRTKARQKASLKRRRRDKYLDNKRRQQANQRRDARNAYVAQLLKSSAGIRRAQIPPALLKAKQEQILLYRSIQETKHAISRSYNSTSPNAKSRGGLKK